MLTKIEAYSASGATLSLPLQSYGSGYVVRDVDGLGPVKAQIVSSKFATLDGSQPQNARRENRNVRLRLGIEQEAGAAVVAQRRAALYSFFMPKRTVTLRLYLDDVHFVSLTGQVESCDPTLFSKDPEVSISLICFDPDLVAPTPVVVSDYSVADATELAIPYSGSVETGFSFKLYVDRVVTEFTLYNRTPNGDIFSYEFVMPLQADDVVEIVTISGSKRATLTRSGSDSSVLYAVSPSATWLRLWPGTNNFRALISGTAIPFDLTYSPRYGGL